MATLLAIYGVLIALSIQLGFPGSVLFFSLKRYRLAKYFLSSGLAAVIAGLLTLALLIVLKTDEQAFAPGAPAWGELLIIAGAYATFGGLVLLFGRLLHLRFKAVTEA